MTTTEFKAPSWLIEEMEAIEAFHENRNHMEKVVTEGELISIFEPLSVIEENISSYRLEIENIGKEYKKDLVRIMSCPEARKDSNKAEFLSMIFWTVNHEQMDTFYRSNLKRLERMKSAIKNKDKPSKDITDDDIARAKTIPIETYMQFSQDGFAKCLWHNEKSGSMKLYRKTNRVHCFGCSKSADVIDIVMEINKVDFIRAVRLILNK